MTTAKRRAVDAIRRDRMHDELARELEGALDDLAEAIKTPISDDLGDELLVWSSRAATPCFD